MDAILVSFSRRWGVEIGNATKPKRTASQSRRRFHLSRVLKIRASGHWRGAITSRGGDRASIARVFSSHVTAISFGSLTRL